VSDMRRSSSLWWGATLRRRALAHSCAEQSQKDRHAMRATVLHKTRDVRVETVPEAAVQSPTMRHPDHSRLHRRERSVALR
jgi:hypothetical protein